MAYIPRKKSTKKPKRKSTKKSKTSMVKLIHSVINKTAESKCISQEMVIGFGNNQQSSVMNVRTLTPSSAFMPII